MQNRTAILRHVAWLVTWGLSFLPHYLAPGATWVRPVETAGSLLMLAVMGFAMRDEFRRGPYRSDPSALKLK